MIDRETIVERTRQLRKKNFTFKEIVNVCEREGLLVKTTHSKRTIRGWFLKAYPSEKRNNTEIEKVNPKHKDLVQEVYIKHLTDMGYTPLEVKAELKRLIK